MKKLFGTDGIRGVANKYPMTPVMAMKTGRALAFFMKQQKSGFSSIVIGKDTRVSGDMLEAALAAGISSMGVNVLCAGVIPTPAVAFLASMIKEAGAGIVISASHNPYYDNGIKIFNSKGYKLSGDEEKTIENLILNHEFNNHSNAYSNAHFNEDFTKIIKSENDHPENCGNGDGNSKNGDVEGNNKKGDITGSHFNIGRISSLSYANEKYAEFLKNLFMLELSSSAGLKLSDQNRSMPENHITAELSSPAGPQPSGSEPVKSGLNTELFTGISKSEKSGLYRKLKLVIDCSNGAASEIAPLVFTGDWFDSEFIFNSPDGRNINENCGSQHTDTLGELVLKHSADLGLAFDGDADRLIALDENAEKITGDRILAICASHAKNMGRLKNNIVVSTVMSNIGLSKTLESLGIDHVTTDVGDRKVLLKMQETGAVMGGEDSGHMIYSNSHTTGDGILTALKIIIVMLDTGKKLSGLASIMKVYPQILMNVEVDPSKPDFMKIKEIADEIHAVENELGKKGRVLVRYSGTQPLLRVMVEGPEKTLTEQYCKRICSAIKTKI